MRPCPRRTSMLPRTCWTCGCVGQHPGERTPLRGLDGHAGRAPGRIAVGPIGGGREVPQTTAFPAAVLFVAVVNPHHACEFGRVLGQLATTDQQPSWQRCCDCTCTPDLLSTFRPIWNMAAGRTEELNRKLHNCPPPKMTWQTHAKQLRSERTRIGYYARTNAKSGSGQAGGQQPRLAPDVVAQQANGYK